MFKPFGRFGLEAGPDAQQPQPVASHPVAHATATDKPDHGLNGEKPLSFVAKFKKEQQAQSVPNVQGVLLDSFNAEWQKLTGNTSQSHDHGTQGADHADPLKIAHEEVMAGMRQLRSDLFLVMPPDELLLIQNQLKLAAERLARETSNLAVHEKNGPKVNVHQFRQRVRQRVQSLIRGENHVGGLNQCADPAHHDRHGGSATSVAHICQGHFGLNLFQATVTHHHDH